jgi:hypothetical protein
LIGKIAPHDRKSHEGAGNRKAARGAVRYRPTSRHARGTRRHARDGDGQARLVKGWR